MSSLQPQKLIWDGWIEAICAGVNIPLEIQDRYTNPETNSEFAPENRPKLPKRK